MENWRTLQMATLFHKVITTKTPIYSTKYHTDVHNLNVQFKELLSQLHFKTEFNNCVFSYTFWQNICAYIQGVKEKVRQTCWKRTSKILCGFSSAPEVIVMEILKKNPLAKTRRGCSAINSRTASSSCTVRTSRGRPRSHFLKFVALIHNTLYITKSFSDSCVRHRFHHNISARFHWLFSCVLLGCWTYNKI